MAVSVTEFQELKSQEIWKMVSMRTQNISGSQVSMKKRPGKTMPERIYNPIMAIGFSAMFTFQLDNTKW